jgi:hypothetical protein
MRLGFIGVFVAVLVTSVAATAALRVSVTPGEGTPRTKFTVSFVVDRKLSADRWFAVTVRSPVRRRDCENEESAVVTYAPTGRRVNVVTAALGQVPMVPWGGLSRRDSSSPPCRMRRTGNRRRHMFQKRPRSRSIQLHGYALVAKRSWCQGTSAGWLKPTQERGQAEAWPRRGVRVRLQPHTGFGRTAGNVTAPLATRRSARSQSSSSSTLKPS